ncbi:FtsB family cell division protein [Dolosicoccus paucivorans]|uniref:Septum formation initiator family protein n=1 Tax=Dolosicoccus paucivorans TaxID=84521 RepID=A0A1G8MHC4_9LACT|nr:septum formation initiator family protein [Dolosicoccus paucivorans]PMB85001.1 hypothetical protein CJ206_01375 [Dolosicoccus paucivorans]PMC57764.1 hypothetical protein CJ205_07925 [Dolosicoccus paucivorans]SDI67296.1 Septum formation initiator [Dolosicoccus paucivorans]
MKETTSQPETVEFSKNFEGMEQQVQKQKEQEIQKIRLFAMIFLAFFLFLSMGRQTYHKWTELKATNQRLDEAIFAEEKSYTKRLLAQEELNRLSDPEYILELARRDLHYSKPDEILFDIPMKDRHSVEQES